MVIIIIVDPVGSNTFATDVEGSFVVILIYAFYGLGPGACYITGWMEQGVTIIRLTAPEIHCKCFYRQ
jgi:hypothetical protein